MSNSRKLRWLIGCCAILAVAVIAYVKNSSTTPPPTHRLMDDGAYHVVPGGDIQAALEAAAKDPTHKHVKIHAGTYKPQRYNQALIWFNQRHDGITLEAVGEVILTGSNRALAQQNVPGYPAMVNHVVYFGDGITPATILRGFKITGANNYMSTSDNGQPIQPKIDDPRLEKRLYFYSDGGGIKIFGRSYPTIEEVEVYDNFSSPCGAGVSVEHRGYTDDSVRLRNCVFRDNRCPVSGAAVDLLRGSAAIIENCLFVDNLSNGPMNDMRSIRVGKWKPQHGSGALTVFPDSKVVVRNCTFTGNRNGVDDSGVGNIYEDSIFWMNNVQGGWPTGSRYEIDIQDANRVRGCFLQGVLIDKHGMLDAETNVLSCPDPDFDESFRPRNQEFKSVGYRP